MVGIDLHLRRSLAVCLDEEGERLWCRRFENSLPPCRIHDLRHTHAAWLIADGEHPKAIENRIGHGSIAVTMDRYGHLMDGLDDQPSSADPKSPT